MNQFLRMEKQLYSDGRVADKYDILEKMRHKLDELYKSNRPVYDACKRDLKPNTWEALEELWTLWNPVPQSHVEWIGPGELTCRLKSSHPSYQVCSEFGFTQCTYDDKGSPDFGKVTYPASMVDISDLYDSLSVDNIQKRGGSANSFQEIAQMRMAERLKPAIEKWAKENGRRADFWEWRNAYDLVPHEDGNCRTMRLVFRPLHIVFKHRGGVANAITIKTHFP